jgi:GNAT superfamily N-acetyltransferase
MWMVRKAEERDLAFIAALHVLSWQTAYKGFVPEEILRSRTVEGSLRGWLSTYDAYPDNLSVVEADTGSLVGFCCAGPVVDTAHSGPFEFEIYGLHVTPDHHREGIGTSLVKGAFDRMRSLELSSAIVWTLENLVQSRQFYERCGGSVVRSGIWTIGDHSQNEVAYGWRNLTN